MLHAKLLRAVTTVLVPLKVSPLLDEASRLVLQDMFLKGQKPRYVEHEAFTYGVGLASDALDDYEEDEMLTLSEVIKEIEVNLSWKQYGKECMIDRHFGWKSIDYACHVGFTYEWFRLLVEHNMISDLATFLPDDGGNEGAMNLPLAA